MVWLTNLYNFMDDADGRVGGMALFGFGAYAIAALTVSLCRWFRARIPDRCIGLVIDMRWRRFQLARRKQLLRIHIDVAIQSIMAFAERFPV